MSHAEVQTDLTFHGYANYQNWSELMTIMIISNLTNFNSLIGCVCAQLQRLNQEILFWQVFLPLSIVLHGSFYELSSSTFHPPQLLSSASSVHQSTICDFTSILIALQVVSLHPSM